MITSVENVENLTILKFSVTQNSRSRIRDKRQVEVRVVVVEIRTLRSNDATAMKTSLKK